MTAVEFGVLGSIETRVDGQLLDLGGAQQRLLLAALLLEVNREVPIDQLADRIWGEDHAQRGTLYSYLSRLRKTLAGADGVEIARRPAGYVLAADPVAVDLYWFRDLVARARAAGEDQRAAELFGQALGLWRGEALAGADSPWAETVRERLHQERLAAELGRVEVRLRLGQHAELLAGLQGQAEEYPWDERLARLLMLALYRCGRTAEALGRYQDIHRALVRDLGMEPGSELRRLHQQILTGDPALAPETAGAAARSTRGPLEVPVPRQLPAPPALFTGRTRELDCLSAVLAGQAEGGGTVVISAIGGVGGVGKTYLAVHWAHRHLDWFPDGQLYVNLRGFDPAAEPMDSSEAVCGFLEALGVAPSAIPATPEAQTALYRSRVAGKRMLIVLDNARDTKQVLPLVPGSPGCAVVVTSRHQLAGLTTAHAAKPLPLDALPEDEARQLLARHLGEERLAAEPEAVAALLAHCAGLPLALSITAARAATQPALALAHLAEELADTETRLDALDTGELTASLRAVFAASYQTLPPGAARAFALLGLSSGPDISLHAAASLIAVSVPRARALLRALESAHLVQQHTLGRYRMHDLVHLFAAEHGHALDEEDRDQALRRLVDFYLHTARHASLVWESQLLFPVDLAPPAAGCTPYRPADREAVWAWFETERSCLLAVQQLAHRLGWHTPTWQLPYALFGFHRAFGDFRAAVAMGQVALEAAGQLPDPRPKAASHSFLGLAYAQNLQVAEAFRQLEQALPVFEQTGDLPGQALTHLGLYSVVAWTKGDRDLRRGLFHAERASRLFHTLDNTVGECYSLSNAGFFHALLGEHRQARACCERAIALARVADNPPGEGYALMWLGYVLHYDGQYTEALAYHHQAITRFGDYTNAIWETMALEGLGFTYRALGQIPEARQAWQHARDLYRAQHRIAPADRLQRRLDTLGDAQGQLGR